MHLAKIAIDTGANCCSEDASLIDDMILREGPGCGGLPERPMGADCKSAGSAFSGSNPLPTTSFSLQVVVSSKPIGR